MLFLSADKKISSFPFYAISISLKICEVKTIIVNVFVKSLSTGYKNIQKSGSFSPALFLSKPSVKFCVVIHAFCKFKIRLAFKKAPLPVSAGG